MNRPGRYQPERQLLGGFRTHQESAPFHGALQSTIYSITERESAALAPKVGQLPLSSRPGFHLRERLIPEDRVGQERRLPVPNLPLGS